MLIKNIVFTLSILFFSFLSYSQNINVANFPYINGQLVDCMQDTAQQVSGFTNWYAYQTTDSSMFGPIDSSCINIYDSTSSWLNLAFDDLDSTLPVYIRHVFDSTNQVLLDSNEVFGINFFADGTAFPWFSSPLVDTSANCKDGLCSGIYVALETPDATGSGTVTTWYSGGYSQQYFLNGYNFLACFPTQNITNETVLKEIIIRMQPTANTVGTNLRIGNVKLDQTYDQNTFTEIQASINSGPQTYYYYFSHQSNLGVYHEPTFPSIANLSYIDVMPSPNTSTIDTINIVVDWLSSLFLQPYTQLRGGLIAGSTTDRHVFNIQQWGGNICLTSYFELIFWGNDRYSYKGGEVSFFGPRGCLLFGNGGKMVIEDDATLNYGRSQQGLLALLPGGTIEIGNNAALNISNTMILNGHPDMAGEPQVYMTLNHGSALNFLPGARIENKSDNPGIKLNIYMEGGEVDLSGLSKKELKYVNLIYRNQYEEQDKNLTIIENPVKDEVRIEYISSSQSNARMEVYDMSGAKVKSIKLSVQPGINYLNFSVLDISQGSYLISFKCKRDNFSRKIIKL